MVSLDLRKTFDTVDYGILMKKLELLGNQGNDAKWFQDYLTDSPWSFKPPR